ncbi:class I SAM-dependent methyltransferase [Snuella lapsa]|uniref:Methyltransferase domain-containing protein n=1 Tax=Snuella lapsa TaxID=870481 RepID=A0ABP6XQV4_9FLAO
MKRLVTIDDIIDTYIKLRLRGSSFILSKFSFNNLKRTKSAFNDTNIKSANWSIIPMVHKRWNTLITGNPKCSYEEFVVKNFLDSSTKIKMLSIGSGVCKHELKFASFKNFEEILCIDISEALLNQAKQTAKQNNLKNITFKAGNIYDHKFKENYFDIVFFHASLHHFKDIETLLGDKLKSALKKNGKLIINEYTGPNRLQFPKHQIKYINRALKLIPKKFRRRYGVNFHKNKVYGSGLIRVILADPSECVESETIIPAIHKYYNTKYEVFYGGNLLMPVLKDLSHHFINLTDEKEKTLDNLFKLEDAYLKRYKSDYVFGIYEKKSSVSLTY